jgi:hypothetical protein
MSERPHIGRDGGHLPGGKIRTAFRRHRGGRGRKQRLAKTHQSVNLAGTLKRSVCGVDAQLIARVLLLDYEPAASVLRMKQDPSAPAAIVTPELRKDLRRTAAQWLTP